MPNQNPEQIARDPIDKQLTACGWVIQGIKQVNLHVGVYVVVKECLLDFSLADFVFSPRSETRQQAIELTYYC